MYISLTCKFKWVVIYNFIVNDLHVLNWSVFAFERWAVSV